MIAASYFVFDKDTAYFSTFGALLPTAGASLYIECCDQRCDEASGSVVDGGGADVHADGNTNGNGNGNDEGSGASGGDVDGTGSSPRRVCSQLLSFRPVTFIGKMSYSR